MRGIGGHLGGGIGGGGATILPVSYIIPGPTGGTTDNLQFDAAVAALKAAGKGGAILWRTGSYKFSAPVNLDGLEVNGITFVAECDHMPIYTGHGWNGSTNVMTATDNGCVIEVQSDIAAFTISDVTADADGRHRNINFIGGAIRGNSSTPASYVGTGISGGALEDRCHFQGLCMYHLKKCLNVSMDDCYIENVNFQDNLQDAITISNSTKGGVFNSLIWDNGGKAIVVNSGVDGFKVVGCDLCAPADDIIYLNGATSCIVSSSFLGQCTGSFIKTNGGSKHSFTGVTCVGNANTSTGFNIGSTTATANVTVTGCSLAQTTSVAGFAINFNNGSSGACGFNTITGGGWNSGSSATIFWNDACTVANNRGDVSTASFPVLSTGTVQWRLKADAITGKVDGDSVTAWVDSAAGLSFSGTGTYKTNRVSYSGKPAILFNGTTNGYSATITSRAQPVTYFAVIKDTDSNSATARDPISCGNGANQGIFINNGTVNLYSGSGVNGQAITQSAWSIVEAVFNGSSSISGVNGVFTSSLNPGSQASGTVAAVGINNGLAAEWFQGDIAEAMQITGALTAADRTAIRQMLAAKYAVAVT